MEVDIRRALQRLAQSRMQRCIRGALDAGATAAYDVLAEYPPVEKRYERETPSRRKRRKYKRTGNLRQKLLIVKPTDDRREVQNTASYYPYVWGSRDRSQAWMHIGIWPTRDDAIAAAEAETRVMLRKLLRREGIVQ